MNSRYRVATLVVAIVAAGLFGRHPLAAQSSPQGKDSSSKNSSSRNLSSRSATSGAKAGTDAAKIREAMSAAPEHIAAHATIMDWADQEGGSMRTLRQGTNGWTCMPSTPRPSGAVGLDPMCLDQQWMNWATAWMSKQSPTITQVGIAYMLKGDSGASNTDPFATSPTADNHWVHSGPHIMVVVPSGGMLDGLSTDPNNGGPWVMWQGTPYAHVMVPAK